MKKIFIIFLIFIFLNVSAQTTISHIVRRGETIESIAKKYEVSVEDLQQLNPSTKKYLYAGMKLVIPPKPSTQLNTQVRDSVLDDHSKHTLTTGSVPYKGNKHKASSHSNLERSNYSSIGITIGHDFTDVVGMTYGIQYQHFMSNGIGATFTVGANYGLEDDADIVFRVGPSYVYPITDILYAMGTACYTISHCSYNGNTGTISGASIIPAIGISFNSIMIGINGDFHWRNGGSIGAGAYLSVAYSF